MLTEKIEHETDTDIFNANDMPNVFFNLLQALLNGKLSYVERSGLSGNYTLKFCRKVCKPFVIIFQGNSLLSAFEYLKKGFFFLSTDIV